MCDWFVDNKLSVHFNQDKTKSILVGTKLKLWNTKALNIVYNGTETKQYAKVNFLGCILGIRLSGESMALNVINIQNHFITPALCRLSCNPLIQPLLIMLAQLGFQISQED